MNTHGPLSVATYVEPSFQENGYLIWTGDAPAAWVIDPGFPPQCDELIAGVRDQALSLAGIVVTHAHPDHIAGVAAMRAAFAGIPLIAPRDEADLLADPQLNLSAQMGMNLTVQPAEQPIAPGDTLTLGPLEFKVLDVAGHSPGGLALYSEAAGVVFTGDALFAGSIGRTDFPGSSSMRLLENIRNNLFTLPDETVVYSGHGPATTIGEERRTNPFV